MRTHYMQLYTGCVHMFACVGSSKAHGTEVDERRY
jgi:hypothetical protein